MPRPSGTHDHDLFARQASKAGFVVTPYEGRNFWKGPAVRVKTAQDGLRLIRRTTMALQQDQMGLGYIYYPLLRDARTPEQGNWYAAQQQGSEASHE